MNINATLIGQSITFLFFVWFCMKFVWPPIMNALETRKKTDRRRSGRCRSRQARTGTGAKKAGENLRDAKAQAAEIIAQAEKRAAQIVEEAKTAAKAEGDRQLAARQGRDRPGSQPCRANSLREQVAIWPWRAQKKSCAVKSMRKPTLTCCGKLKAEL